MCYYVYADHAQYTIKTYAKMALFRLVLTGVLSIPRGSYTNLWMRDIGFTQSAETLCNGAVSG